MAQRTEICVMMERVIYMPNNFFAWETQHCYKNNVTTLTFTCHLTL